MNSGFLFILFFSCFMGLFVEQEKRTKLRSDRSSNEKRGKI